MEWHPASPGAIVGTSGPPCGERLPPAELGAQALFPGDAEQTWSGVGQAALLSALSTRPSALALLSIVSAGSRAGLALRGAGGLSLPFQRQHSVRGLCFLLRGPPKRQAEQGWVT